MKQAGNTLAQRFDAMNPRERVMVFLAGVAVIVALGFVLAIDGALARHKLLAAPAAKQRGELAQLQQQNNELTGLLAQDADAEGRRKIEALQLLELFPNHGL